MSSALLRCDNNSVQLAYLLDVNSSPGKHIHELRVLPALLIAMAQTKISIVSPRVYFFWVCSEDRTVTGTASAPVHKQAGFTQRLVFYQLLKIAQTELSKNTILDRENCIYVYRCKEN